MEKRVKRFEVGYDYIAPDSLVVATTPFDGLTMGQVYRVKNCREPRSLEGLAHCTLRKNNRSGKVHVASVPTIRLREVTLDELTNDQTRLRGVA